MWKIQQFPDLFQLLEKEVPSRFLKQDGTMRS